MNCYLLFCIISCASIRMCIADSGNVQDVCPADHVNKQGIFINGLPCKKPTTVTASDFKSSKLSQPGDTDNFLRSSLTIATAVEFPGLNTLGLSIARTDFDVDGLVLPHSHPRASEILFVGIGIVIAGFVDSKKQLFQITLKEGDVFVVPQGLLHFCLNAGNDVAVVYSVLNSQNPGLVSVADSMFNTDSDSTKRLINRVKSLSASAINTTETATVYGF